MSSPGGPLTHHEKQAVTLLRTQPLVTVGTTTLQHTANARKFNLGRSHVRPTVADGLERGGIATTYRPAHRGPKVLIPMAKAKNDDTEMALWKRNALIFDVLIEGEKRGQIAATCYATARFRAREFWQLENGTDLEVCLVGNLYGDRR